MAEEGRSQQELQPVTDLTPMKRGAKPEEVAWCVLFLASDEASCVTAELCGRRRLLGGLAVAASYEGSGAEVSAFEPDRRCH